ncbi:hypothetical protein MLD38_032757 [Melastoma candidum]|uniref:Uncharacterized protein n=1 Tax=Melastoma candidum TaxID=119954 RepID=A0ACB9M4Y6_9MYRT|nr:hypothetical protein MLD38_032757 [Melastoma candidum]
MRRAKPDKFDAFQSLCRQRSFQILLGVGFLYLVLVTVEIPYVSRETLSLIPRSVKLQTDQDIQTHVAPSRPLVNVTSASGGGSDPAGGDLSPAVAVPRGRRVTRRSAISGLDFGNAWKNGVGKGFSGLHKSAKVAWDVGRKFWSELASGKVVTEKPMARKGANATESCPHSLSLSGPEFLERKRVLVLPCGLTLGSHITVVGKPRGAHSEKDPKIALVKDDEEVMVSQFHMELQGLRNVEGEDPPRILHFNPRLKGDWSGKPVIEQNTCYRMQWGTALRCEGWRSRADEETVDGQLKCEKWIRDDDNRSEESKASWWLNRLIGKTKKVAVDWPYPFAEDRLFVMTISAGLEGYHISVDGRHVTSFPYRTGFALEDATGLTLNGDVDVHSIFAAALPTVHPNYAPQRHLELSSRWQAPPVSDEPVEMFIGILSAGNHFAERMAVRKSWMQHKLVKSSNVVARFFVALHSRKEVNVELKKEADFFGDIVIVPYMDNYDLVVLKTVAICEYGIRQMSAKYVMKCDDDTFVRLDAVLDEVRKVPNGKSLYIGNINFYHKPLRYGKWAVTYEEWPEEEYPPYANGPGYVLSSDIAHFIVAEFESLKLRLFKMEDVSVGMWVEQFNGTMPVEYVHNLKFCQFGCINDYYTAHYQSPRQMICLWDKLQEEGMPVCCDMR